jgi:diguanylate cyclase (GGDEF)-like protein/PAS domain S-box-containing protein
MVDLFSDKQGSLWSDDFFKSTAFVEFINLIPEAAVFSDQAGHIVLTNGIAQTLFQYSPAEFKKITVEDLVPKTVAGTHAKFREWFFKNPTPRFLEGREVDLSALKKDKSLFPMEAALFAIKTESGLIAVNLIRDISAKKADQAKIKEYAFIDALTNLPNRRYFEENLKRNSAKARRHHQMLALLFIDLDHFKPINDNEGHEVGDTILRVTADRLAGALRDEDFLARIGGDEFVVMVYPLEDKTMLTRICERLLSACRPIITEKNKTFKVTISIGVSVSGSGHFEEQPLLVDADKAMYSAKKQGGNTYCISGE